MTYTDRFDSYGAVISAPLDKRVQFIQRTYLHLTGAVLAFVFISFVFHQIGLGAWMMSLIAGSRFGWLMILGGFALLGWMSTSMAHSAKSLSTQYAGLGVYTLAQAIIFAPMLFLAATFAPGVLPQAAGITILTFGGLSLYVMNTKKDFSFLRTALMVGGFVALGAIVAGAIFGFTLGIGFSAIMILFACFSILYSTSNVLHHYGTNQYVAASLELFAAVALLFWYVLRLLMELQRR